MAKSAWKICLLLILLAALDGSANGQGATFHLHGETSSTAGLLQLGSAPPDSATITLESAELRNSAAGEHLVQAFDTQSGVPNRSGTIAAGSSITVTLWMRKSASFASMFPAAKLRLNKVDRLRCRVAWELVPLARRLLRFARFFRDLERKTEYERSFARP
jgi:hypothetical protein